MANTPMLYLLLLLNSAYVWSDYFVQVRIHSYSNPTNGCAPCDENGCCDRFSGPMCAGRLLCDTYFTFCLQLSNSTTLCSPQAISDTVWDGAPTNFSQPTVLGLSNPLLLPGVSRQWEGALLYITAMDDDSNSVQDLPNDLIDDFPITITNNTAIVMSELEPRTFTGRNRVAQIEISAQVVCAPDFTGERCGDVINDCINSLSNCSGHGKCIDGIQSFKCNCKAGFAGKYCEIDINECEGDSCNENGMCVDGIANFTCVCSPGYTGRYCEIDIDDCANVNCTNGKCRDKLNSYVCECDPGFEGEYCVTNINDCVNVFCSGRGTCVDGVNFFTCDCLPGYNGVLCESNIDDCLGVDCTGNRQCLDGLNSYECVCNEDFSGADCNLRISHLERSVIVGPIVGMLITILVVVCLVVTAVIGIKGYRKKGTITEQLNDTTLPFIGRHRMSKANAYAALHRPAAGISIHHTTAHDNSPIYWNPDATSPPIRYVNQDSMRTCILRQSDSHDVEDSTCSNPLYDNIPAPVHSGKSVELTSTRERNHDSRKNLEDSMYFNPLYMSSTKDLPSPTGSDKEPQGGSVKWS